MTQSVYLARHFNDNPEVLGDFAFGAVVGTNPLDVEDGSTGYVQATWESPSLDMTMVTFRLQHDGVSPVRTGDVTAVYADVSYQVSTTGLVLPDLLLRNYGTSDQRPATGFTLEPTTWTREIKEMSLPSDPAEWNDVDDPTYPWRLATTAAGTFETSMTAQVTYLRIIVEWGANPIPLRLRQRGDGLGMGGPRLFGRGSRQRSPRARGYL